MCYVMACCGKLFSWVSGQQGFYMALYLASPLHAAERQRFEQALTAAIEERDRFALTNGAWIIDFQGTSRELSDKIGTTSDPRTTGSVLYTGISGYWGYGPTTLWEWLRSRLEKS